MNRSIPGTLIALLVTSVGVAGQLTTEEDAVFAVSRLAIGQQVRVAAPGVTVDLGTVTELDGATFVVAQDGQEWIIAATGLERLEVRRRSIAPSVLGLGLAGLMGGLLVNKMLHESGDPEANKVPIGLALGAGLGFAIGMNKWKWTVAFPRPF